MPQSLRAVSAPPLRPRKYATRTPWRGSRRRRWPRACARRRRSAGLGCAYAWDARLVEEPHGALRVCLARRTRTTSEARRGGWRESNSCCKGTFAVAPAVRRRARARSSGPAPATTLMGALSRSVCCRCTRHSVVVALDVPGPSPPCRVSEACSLRRTRDSRTADCLPRRKFEWTRQQRSAQRSVRPPRSTATPIESEAPALQPAPAAPAPPLALFAFTIYAPASRTSAGRASGSRPDLASSPHPTHAALSCSASTSRAQTLISHLLSPANVDRKQCRLRNAAASSSSLMDTRTCAGVRLVRRLHLKRLSLPDARSM
jgi:hypothetical protein